MMEKLSDIIKFDENGLIPVIVQDYKTDQILMLAWMNKESLEITYKKKTAHYFSRSRKKLWQKGETSGQIQEVQKILIDCDGDSLILKVKQTGVACHTGRMSCFFRDITDQFNVEINQKIITPPEKLYDKNK